MQLRYRIFKFFGVYAKRQDTYKDVNGKGVKERYQESLGWEYDDDVSDLIDNLLNNIIVPATMKSNIIPLAEYNLGGIVVPLNNDNLRRKILRFAQRLYDIKGTLRGYIVLFNMIGITSVIIDLLSGTGTLDSGPLDDPNRTLDSNNGCGCIKYNLVLSGSISINDDVISAIYKIVDFNNPINAEVVQITYNGNPLTPGSPEGIFDSTFDTTFN